MKHKTVSTIAAILCGTLLAFVVRAQENEQVKAAATRPNSESAQPAAEKKKVRGTAADLLLNISGVEASVVLSPDGEGGVFASARSIGEINVQILMEKLGGGGNRNAAATRMADIDIDEALQKLHEAIDDYLS